MELGPLRVRVSTGWTFAGLPGEEDDEDTKDEEVEAVDVDDDPDAVAADEELTENNEDVAAGPTGLTEERDEETPRPQIPPVEQYSKPSSEVQVIS